MRISQILPLLLLLTPALSFAQSDQSEGAKRVETAIRGLSSETEGVRMNSLRTLSDLAPIAKPAVPALIDALEVKDIAFQNEAVMVLGRIGPDAEAAIPSLTNLLEGESLILQHSAIHSLRLIGPASQSATPQLKLLTESSKDFVSVPAAWTLVSVNPDDLAVQRAMTPKLVAALEIEAEEIAVDAVYGLAEIGKPAVEAVLAAIEGGNPQVCMHACDALAGMQSDGQSGIPGLLKCLAHDSEQVQWHAARAIGEVGSSQWDKDVVQALKAKLTSRNLALKAGAAGALGSLGAASAPAVNELALLLADADPRIRATAARALGMIGEPASNAVPRLVQALNDDEGIVTISAAEALGQIGQAAVPSILPVLAQPELTHLMLNVLAEMGPAASSAALRLVDLLDSDDLDIRIEAAVALGRIGPGASKAVPALMKRLQDENYDPRGAIVFALAKIGAREAIPVLRQTARSDDERLQRASAWGLVMLDPDQAQSVKDAVPILTKGLEDERPIVRQEVSEALAVIGPSAESAVPALIKAYGTDESDEVRASALYAVVEIAPQHPNLLGLANQALDSPHPMTRITAAYAAGRIGAGANHLAPHLHRMLRSKDRVEKVVGAWSLLQVAPTSEHVAVAGPWLLEGLTSDDPSVRAELTETIGRFKNDIPGAKTALRQLQDNDDDPDVRAAAERALSN